MLWRASVRANRGPTPPPGDRAAHLVRWRAAREPCLSLRLALRQGGDYSNNTEICISIPMKTTLDINDAILIQAKSVAARERTSLTRLIEEGLALRLRTPRHGQVRRRPRLPVYAGTGGLTAAVKDSLCNRALLDAADEDARP